MEIEITVLETIPKATITTLEEQATLTIEETQITVPEEESRRALHLVEEVRIKITATAHLLARE